MAKKYQMVRLELSTWQALQEAKTRMEISNLEGKTCYAAHDQFGISLDTVIKTLLERDARHKSRKKSHADRKGTGTRFTAEGSIRPARLHNVEPGDGLYTESGQEDDGGEE